MSEVERGGAGERDTGGRAPAPLGTTDHGRARGGVWTTWRKQFKNISYPFHPFQFPLCGQSVGVPLSLAHWVSPQDTILPSQG